ncbi:hypothetical protein ACUH7Y_09700 [Clostridium beijerinckii]|uniref:Uncharacterized protein n=1 Tax=Clostridium beijerinckii TaxID=1520 RepID=A0A7X9SMG5_CLOBE|nr:hypothetical protein [Clostridium beijerinckii]NMF04585.1 hypothetical protein [Clostridium beijerinckii]
MELKDIKTIQEVADEYNISRQTLHGRLKNLQEGIEYRRLGERQPILLSPEGVKKIVKSTIEDYENMSKEQLINIIKKGNKRK